MEDDRNRFKPIGVIGSLWIILWCLLPLLVSCTGNQHPPSPQRVLDQDGCNEFVVNNQNWESVIVRVDGIRIGRVEGLTKDAFLRCGLLNRRAEFVLEVPVSHEVYPIYSPGHPIEDHDGFFVDIGPIYLHNSHVEVYNVAN